MSFPSEVRSAVGYALYAAQNGHVDPAAKPMKGFGGASVMEIIAPFAGNTWRRRLHRPLSRSCLCPPRFSEEIQIRDFYSKERNRPDLSAAGGCSARLRNEAEALCKPKKKIAKKPIVTKGSGNVFADLSLPNADQELMKARLTLQIHRIIQERGLTQTEAGKILGIPQPQVSALARNRSGNFSVGRLLEFLTALGQDVKITVTPARKLHGQMSVVVA